jgi:hypothetical protein
VRRVVGWAKGVSGVLRTIIGTVQRQAWCLVHIVTGIACGVVVCLGAHYWSWGLYWDTLATTWGDHPDPEWCFNGCLEGGNEADWSTDHNPFWRSWEGECGLWNMHIVHSRL